MWRMKQKINPRPKLPKTHEDYMNTENIPDTYTKTADNGDFIIFKDWIDYYDYYYVSSLYLIQR